MSFSHGEIKYGKRPIRFSVLYVDRKTLEIAVYPDQRVFVKAPLGTEEEEIRKRVIKRARWITRQLEYFRQFEPRTPKRKYVGGETHLYLGRHYRLKVFISRTPGVKFTRGFCLVAAKTKLTAPQVKAVLDRWYEEKAHERFSAAFEASWRMFDKLGLAKPKLFIKRMKTRWGSLSKKGALTLNVDLVRAPAECIVYVIAHELCHLKHHDHSAGFYRMLGKVMPDWEKRKRRLEMTLA